MLIIHYLPQVLEKKYQSKLSDIVVWNQVWLLYNVFFKNIVHQGLTLLHVWRELTLCLSLNYVSTTIQTYVKVMHWE